MGAFENVVDKDGFALKLWRGESMCMLGMDVPNPEADLVGFSIEVKAPDRSSFTPLRNRLAFSYSPNAGVTGDKKFLSTEAPFQKFRWVHFPQNPSSGTYEYRVTKQHMPKKDEKLKAGTSHTLGISLDPVTYDGVLDVGFTRNFASSQAYEERYPGRPAVIPGVAKDGLSFKKLPGDIYQWLGFEAYKLLFETLDEAVADKNTTLDVLAYDLNEPDIVDRLAQLGSRLRIVVDDSKEHRKADSAETAAVARLRASAGASNVTRTNFDSQQHNKVLILKRHGVPKRVLVGSTNFSFRGLYIQSNNMIVFRATSVAELFSKYFDAVFSNPDGYSKTAFASQWHRAATNGGPEVQVCFSPHPDVDLSLNPVRGAIDQATSSVFYSVAFLNQTGGATREALDRLVTKDLFSYGIVDKRGELSLKKPDGSFGVVDFARLSKTAPSPFKEEWAGGAGLNVHHKFVVTDFNLPTARVFTGSSNLSPNAEKNNGDHLIMIADRRVATAYAIEALRVFDHLHFRNRMRDASTASGAKKDPMTLRKPRQIEKPGVPAWFEKYFGGTNTQRQRDRELFAGRA